MRILLRCDASAGSGVGHLVRCLALAEAAGARGWDATLVGDVGTPLARRLAERSRVTAVPAPAGGAGSPRSFASWAADQGADVLHLDHYGIDGTWVGCLPGGIVSSTEDGTFGRRAADLVVDPTLGADRGDRPADGSPRVLRGVRYAPLRSAVRAARASAGRTSASGVLVVMGGTDAFGMTVAAARVAHAAGASGLTVVVPDSTARAVRAAVPSATVLGPQDDLPALAARASVAVSAAGTSVCELACVGVPMALVPVTGNQVTGYSRAIAAGLAVGLGTSEQVQAGGDPPVHRLRALLEDASLRRSMREAGRSTVDGLGADRLLDAWWEGSGRAVLSVRPAGTRDTDTLLRWRNDPVTRASSRTTGPVTREEHDAWLSRTLRNPDRLLLVVERTGTPVATVRLDRDVSDSWEISLTVAPEARGRGVGPSAVLLGEAFWRERTGGRGRLVAHVRAENTASATVFRAAGYLPRPASRSDALDVYVKG